MFSAKQWAWIIIDTACAQRVQVYSIFRVYREYFGTARTGSTELAVLAVPTNEILPVLAVPEVQNSEILPSTGSTYSNEPRNAVGPELL